MNSEFISESNKYPKYSPHKYSYRNGPPIKERKKSPKKNFDDELNKLDKLEKLNSLNSLNKANKKKTFYEVSRKKSIKNTKRKNNISSAFDTTNISVKMISGKSLRRKKEKRTQLCKQIDSLSEEEIRFLLMKVGIQTSKELPRSMLVSLAKCYFFN